MKLYKLLLAITAIGAGILIFNTKAYASNSYYLMSCTEQKIPTGYYSGIDTTVSESEFRKDLHHLNRHDSVKNILCDKCNVKSKLENKCRYIFDKYNVIYESQKIFKNLV